MTVGNGWNSSTTITPTEKISDLVEMPRALDSGESCSGLAYKNVPFGVEKASDGN